MNGWRHKVGDRQAYKRPVLNFQGRTRSKNGPHKCNAWPLSSRLRRSTYKYNKLEPIAECTREKPPTDSSVMCRDILATLRFCHSFSVACSTESSSASAATASAAPPFVMFVVEKTEECACQLCEVGSRHCASAPKAIHGFTATLHRR